MIIHKTIHVVENNSLYFSQTVESVNKVCYNENMLEFDYSYYEKKINSENKEAFENFRALLLDYNKRFNLTSITEEKDIFYKHFLDSILGERFFKQNATVLEVGSGAGFPSIPLKIIRPDLKFTLIESTGKKCEFLKIAAKELGFSQFTVLNLRAEDGAKNPEYREKFDVCVARAVASLPTLTEYCLPFVKLGGVQIAYKGAQEELSSANYAIRILGGGNAQEYRYSLPEGYGERSLIVIEKIKNTPQAYPRGNGKERSRPLLGN